MKGPDAGTHRYGVFGPQPPATAASSSACDNKENLPEVREQQNLDGRRTRNADFMGLIHRNIPPFFLGAV